MRASAQAAASEPDMGATRCSGVRPTCADLAEEGRDERERESATEPPVQSVSVCPSYELGDAARSLLRGCATAVPKRASLTPKTTFCNLISRGSVLRTRLVPQIHLKPPQIKKAAHDFGVCFARSSVQSCPAPLHTDGDGKSGGVWGQRYNRTRRIAVLLFGSTRAAARSRSHRAGGENWQLHASRALADRKLNMHAAVAARHFSSAAVANERMGSRGGWAARTLSFFWVTAGTVCNVYLLSRSVARRLTPLSVATW